MSETYVICEIAWLRQNPFCSKIVCDMAVHDVPALIAYAESLTKRYKRSIETYTRLVAAKQALTHRLVEECRTVFELAREIQLQRRLAKHLAAKALSLRRRKPHYELQ